MSDTGTICIGSRWLAGFMSAMGFRDAEPPVEFIEGGRKTQRYYLAACPELRGGIMIAAWEASEKGNEHFDAYADTLTESEDKALAEFVNTYYCALVMSERWRKVAEGNQKYVLRNQAGRVRGIIPRHYGPLTARKFGIPYPPPAIA